MIQWEQIDTNDYVNILWKLRQTAFRWSEEIPMDANRAADGIELRGRFAEETGHDYRAIREYITSECSVLEMMVGLADRMENGILGDFRLGNRTGLWFWTMVDNLGLLDFDRSRYDEWAVEDIIDRFLDRQYEPDGTGSLFKIGERWFNPPTYLTKSQMYNENFLAIEIWYQMQFWCQILKIE